MGENVTVVHKFDGSRMCVDLSLDLMFGIVIFPDFSIFFLSISTMSEKPSQILITDLLSKTSFQTSLIMS